jgi:hypothetical protein
MEAANQPNDSYCFTSRSRIFHLYGDVTITGEGLQNLGLCSALRAFEQGGIFIVSEGPPHLIASYDTGSILTRIPTGATNQKLLDYLLSVVKDVLDNMNAINQHSVWFVN